MKVKFKCPNCENDQVEEVVGGFIQYSVVTDIEIEDPDGEVWVNLDYGEVSYEPGREPEIIDYVCSKCGYRIGVDNPTGLSAWLEDRGMIEKG